MKKQLKSYCWSKEGGRSQTFLTEAIFDVRSSVAGEVGDSPFPGVDRLMLSDL